MAVTSATTTSLPPDALNGLGAAQISSISPPQRPDADRNQNPGQNEESTIVTLSQNAQNLFRQSQQQDQVETQNTQQTTGTANQQAAVGNVAVSANNVSNSGGSPGIQFVPGESKGGLINTYA